MSWTTDGGSGIKAVGMKDIYNPMVLLSVVIMLAVRVTTDDGGLADTLDVYMLSICAAAFAVCACLLIARLSVRRRTLMLAVWALVYLIVGCCVWAVSFNAGEQDDETAAFRRLYGEYRETGHLPPPDENGDTLPVLAASLGRSDCLKKLLKDEALSPEEAERAAARAAGWNHAKALKFLLDAGVSPDAAPEGVSLLNTAAQNACTATLHMLLRRGADPNLADDEGTPPLIHAAIADREAPVRLLLKFGADRTKRDAAGRDAAGYARSSEIAEMLERGVPSE